MQRSCTLDAAAYGKYYRDFSIAMSSFMVQLQLVTRTERSRWVLERSCTTNCDVCTLRIRNACRLSWRRLICSDEKRETRFVSASGSLDESESGGALRTSDKLQSRRIGQIRHARHRDQCPEEGE
ncbi:hypothetical protein J6590_041424 [Homalodisca vitripennis]|nr:hypothetical protein J6590_041424 [Homalodisca vitripennis]